MRAAAGVKEEGPRREVQLGELLVSPSLEREDLALGEDLTLGEDLALGEDCGRTAERQREAGGSSAWLPWREGGGSSAWLPRREGGRRCDWLRRREDGRRCDWLRRREGSRRCDWLRRRNGVLPPIAYDGAVDCVRGSCD